MSKKKINKIAEEKAFDYQRALGMIDSVSDDHVIARRMGFYDGFIAGAEWGEKNAYKAIMKKADGVRDKRFDADYEVKIEPAAGFDLGCVNVYREGKLVGQYVEPNEEKKLPEGVEEAAEESWIYYEYRDSGHLYSSVYKDAFKAGAEWDAEHEKDYFVIKLGERI